MSVSGTPSPVEVPPNATLEWHRRDREQPSQSREDRPDSDVLAAALMIPPANFCMVARGIYRSGYPNHRNFGFLKTLRLRSIVYLSPDPYLDANMEFVSSERIQLHHLPVANNGEPFSGYASAEPMVRARLSCNRLMLPAAPNGCIAIPRSGRLSSYCSTQRIIQFLSTAKRWDQAWV
eukprot:SAG31_NODE_1705_length_7491_cov_3.705222_4_plen_178_part_00